VVADPSCGGIADVDNHQAGIARRHARQNFPGGDALRVSGRGDVGNDGWIRTIILYPMNTETPRPFSSDNDVIPDALVVDRPAPGDGPLAHGVPCGATERFKDQGLAVQAHH
jgi:hypothetical protein